MATGFCQKKVKGTKEIAAHLVKECHHHGHQVAQTKAHDLRGRGEGAHGVSENVGERGDQDGGTDLGKHLKKQPNGNARNGLGRKGTDDDAVYASKAKEFSNQTGVGQSRNKVHSMGNW